MDVAHEARCQIPRTTLAGCIGVRDDRNFLRLPIAHQIDQQFHAAGAARTANNIKIQIEQCRGIGRSFTDQHCVGWLDKRYGPTLAWGLIRLADHP